MELKWILLSLAAAFFFASFCRGQKLEALSRGYEDLNRLRNLESKLYRKSGLLFDGHASVSRPTPEAEIRHNVSLLYEFATRHLIKIGDGNEEEDVDFVDEEVYCGLEKISETICESLRYRTFSGRCNNLRNPATFGKHTIPLRRILPPEYEDGISEPRLRSVIPGSNLPNVRLVTSIVHRNISRPHKKHTLMLMQWGQFLDHDLTATPMVRGRTSGHYLSFILNCSDCDSEHPACFPIKIPERDPYFPARDPQTGKPKCISFARSMSGQMNFGPREQLNQVTAFIDFSQLYGSTVCRSEQIRKKIGGKMKWLDHPESKYFKHLLPTAKAAPPPTTTSTTEDNNRRSSSKPVIPGVTQREECRSAFGLCFHAGDDRSNEQPGLTSLHTLFLREHNRVADQLSTHNPHWSDERIFQQARRILIAVNQHITYNEFLPRILGEEIMDKYGLTLGGEGGNFYDERCSPNIFNEFSTAAFRFGHSLISPMFKMAAGKNLRLSDHFNNPDIVRSVRFIDHLLGGLISESMESFDSSVTSEVTNHLFEDKSRPYSGLDLAALNLQRGRDHGIPGYIKYRKWCGLLPEIKDFRDLARINGDKITAKRLASVYKHVTDIDLFSGGLSERPVRGGVVGPTFACLIAHQFKQLKKCDRFWYETKDPKIGFEPQQLNEIRKVTLASVICRNRDDIFGYPVQKNVMDLPDDENPYLKCDEEQPTIDFRFWRQEVASKAKNGGALAPGPPCEYNGFVFPEGSKRRVSPCVSCRCLLGGKPLCVTIIVYSCPILISNSGYDAVKLDEACSSQCPLNT